MKTRDEINAARAQWRLATGRTMGDATGARGERNHFAKLTWAQVRAIRASYTHDFAKLPPAHRRNNAAGALRRELATRYNVHHNTILLIVTGATWSAATGPVSVAKSAAARHNGKSGGRPRNRCEACAMRKSRCKCK